MKRDVTLLLQDILENIDLIEKNVGRVNKEKVIRDKMLQNALVRCIEIIGEAVKNIPRNLKERYPAIKWKDIIGTRDIIAHAYFRVDLDISRISYVLTLLPDIPTI